MKRLILFLGLIFSSAAFAGPYTQEEMCDLIPIVYRTTTPPIHIFFDAQDRGSFGTTIRKKRFYNFSIEKEVSGGHLIRLGDLGEIFKGFASGTGYTTEQHGIYFDDGVRPNGRVITKIFNFPKKIAPDSTLPTWSIYKLCKQEICRQEEPAVRLGDWELQTDRIDIIRINSAEVYAFYFNEARVPPKLECLPGPFPHSDGPLERH